MRRRNRVRAEKTEYRAGRNGVYEPTETEYTSRQKQNQEARGEISRCIEDTGWLYIAEKEQTSRDFHKKM